MVGGKRNTVTNLTNCLIDQSKSTFAMTALIWRCLFQLMVRVLQQAERRVHVRLLGQGVSDTHARRDGQRDEQLLPRY
jgi:chorismate-pyruvate lyase